MITTTCLQKRQRLSQVLLGSATGHDSCRVGLEIPPGFPAPTCSLLLPFEPVSALLLPTCHSFTREQTLLVLCIQRPAPAASFSSKRTHSLDVDRGLDRALWMERRQRGQKGRRETKYLSNHTHLYHSSSGWPCSGWPCSGPRARSVPATRQKPTVCEEGPFVGPCFTSELAHSHSSPCPSYWRGAMLSISMLSASYLPPLSPALDPWSPSFPRLLYTLPSSH